MPALYLMSADTHAALRSYVAGGGTVVIGFGSGLVDEHTRTTLGSLDDLIGARITRHVWLLPDETVAVAGGLLGRTWFDELAVGSASVLLRAEDGRPVIISNRYGDGEVRYIATDLDDDPFGGVA